jgi:hypothetical protein
MWIKASLDTGDFSPLCPLASLNFFHGKLSIRLLITSKVLCFFQRLGLHSSVLYKQNLGNDPILTPFSWLKRSNLKAATKYKSMDLLIMYTNDLALLRFSYFRRKLRKEKVWRCYCPGVWVYPSNIKSKNTDPHYFCLFTHDFILSILS